MSLDVYLTIKGIKSSEEGSGIFVREDGQTKEISRQEWEEKFPDKEPVVVSSTLTKDDEVYTRNITHNLAGMAEQAGLYKCLWRPDEHGFETAKQLIEPLTKGLALLESDPSRFMELNPSNGWGTYDGLVSFVREYLEACKEYPEAVVSVSVWR